MFPSSGLFADTLCPFQRRGLCERPHCPYRHAAAARDVLGSPSGSAGAHNGCPYGVCEAPVSDEPGGDCFQELERINKEIETVRHEVEQEQQRLSRYQTLQTDSFSETAGTNLDFSKTLPQAKKYVVDNSKPRTDLEYDPLSNYSADLRSYSLTNKEQNHIKKGQSLKRARNAAPCDQKKPPAHQSLLSKSSPEPLDDFNEDCVLIIDIPPSPVKKRCRNSEVARTEVDNSPEPTIPSPTWKGLVVEEEENTAESPQCELSRSVGKMNFPQTNSLFYKAPDGDLDSPSRQHINQAQPEQSAQSRVHVHLSPKQMTPSLASDCQKTLRKMPGQMQDEAVTNPTSCVRFQEQVEPSVGSHLTNGPESESTDQLLVKADDDAVIIINSSSEEGLHFSDVDMSDSDPMEECYRIFMEANNENKGNEEQPNTSVGAVDVEKSELDVKSLALPGKKRVAHEAKHTEQPVAKSRPQPQVLVPLRGPATPGFGFQPSVSSKIVQVQQRASMLTASVKGGQAFVSSTCQRKPEIQNAPSTSSQTLENLQPAPLQNTYRSYIPLGTAVINMGNSLHLILPEGVYPVPVASTSSSVTPLLTPISQIHASTVSVKQTYCPAAVIPVQRYRSAAPVLIPAPAIKPSLTSGFALAQSSSAALTACQPAVSAAVAKVKPQPVPTKRKLKHQCEAAKDKVPHDVRQRYVNMFTKEFLKTSANVNDAFEKALAEERTVYNRSVNKLKYLSVAVNALKRLKNQSAVAAKDENQMNKERSKGNIPLNLNNVKGNDDTAFYQSLTDYILPEETLVESNYPVPHPEKPGSAALFADSKKSNADSLKRICCRCGATYSVSRTGKHIRKEECNYHYGKGVENRVPGGVETRYSCCEGVMGAPGCQVFKLHVHDSLSLDGFVSSVSRPPSDTSCPGVYALDCEMCYTIHGLELSRVTVVNSSLQVIYDTFVKPDDVIDYNTRFTGISEEDVKSNHPSLREVQQTLLSFISADTILVGHGLEADLCALKLLHSMVVDTSVVFPHRLGPPHKLTLNSLTAENLRRIIQESVCGHDTAEDAAACMELMLWKVKEDGKLKK